MNKQEIEKWQAASAIAVMNITNTCSMAILGYEYDINDKVIVRRFIGDIHRYTVKLSHKGFYFTYCNGCRYYIKDFLTV